MNVNRLIQSTYWRLIIITVFLKLFSSTVQAAPDAKLDSFWVPHDEASELTIDHSLWQSILSQYLSQDNPIRIALFDYANVSQKDKDHLKTYIQQLASLDPRQYSRAEQKAFWINLYNALTVQLILENYPIESITKLGESFFRFGPWDDEIINIQSRVLSLNDIEHRILRPIWKDKRIHYAVNCASISCPNLSEQAFTAANTESLLEKGAYDYINHPRGVSFDDEDLVVSSIFEWYKGDFGGNNQALVEHFIHYAKPALKKQLLQFSGDIDDEYDWGLNSP